ncbi:MAG: hypothetical protein RI980_328 [Bacteroidota bacterium]
MSGLIQAKQEQFVQEYETITTLFGLERHQHSQQNYLIYVTIHMKFTYLKKATTDYHQVQKKMELRTFGFKLM